MTSLISTIPIIDFSLSQSDKIGFAQQLGTGLKEFGFIALKNHSIDPTLFSNNYKALEEIFDLPEEVKNKYSHPEIGGQRGYLPLSSGETHSGSKEVDAKECWQIGGIDATNIYPEEVPNFHRYNYQLFMEMESIAFVLLEALDVYLETNGMLESLVKRKIGGKGYFSIGTHLMRNIHYPPLSNPTFNEEDLVIRGVSHVDLNLITLLPTSTNEGLQIFKKDGTWMSINMPPDYIIVNAADMLYLITKGTDKEIPSTPHRIVGDQKTVSQHRYSCPFFIHPNHNLPLTHIKTKQPVVVNNIPMTESGMFVHWRLTCILPEGTVPPYEEWKEKNKPFTYMIQ